MELVLCSQSFHPPYCFMGVEINWSSVTGQPCGSYARVFPFSKEQKNFTLIQWQRVGRQLCFKNHRDPQESQAGAKMLIRV